MLHAICSCLVPEIQPWCTALRFLQRQGRDQQPLVGNRKGKLFQFCQATVRLHQFTQYDGGLQNVSGWDMIYLLPEMNYFLGACIACFLQFATASAFFATSLSSPHLSQNGIVPLFGLFFGC